MKITIQILVSNLVIYRMHENSTNKAGKEINPQVERKKIRANMKESYFGKKPSDISAVVPYWL